VQLKPLLYVLLPGDIEHADEHIAVSPACEHVTNWVAIELIAGQASESNGPAWSGSLGLGPA
jgi:hypothetical protein